MSTYNTRYQKRKAEAIEQFNQKSKARKREKAEKTVVIDGLKADVYLVAERRFEESAKEGYCYICHKKIYLPEDDVILVPDFTYMCPPCALRNTTPRSWVDVVVSSIYNLEVSYRRLFFHHKNEICDYIDLNWNVLCGKRKRTPTWWKTVLATITTRSELFQSEGWGENQIGIINDYRFWKLGFEI